MKTALKVCAIAALLVGVGFLNTGEMRDALPPCPTEDSDNCYWDASESGNGDGQDFWVINGTVHYDK